jgi:hypothetical protein
MAVSDCWTARSGKPGKQIRLVIILLVYNGQNSADEVKQIAMTQSSVCHPIGTGLGLRTMIALRRERHMWTVPQACQAAPSKACRAASAITGTR